MEQDEIIDVIEIVPDDEEPALSAGDLDVLREAKRRLEHPSLTARLSDMVGRPLRERVPKAAGPLARNHNRRHGDGSSQGA